MTARLLLEDGKEFIGEAIGSKKISFGEIVFNTGMTGYQEIITDPSYAGQIITFTYPEIGNYGCNEEDMESKTAFAKGIVIKNLSPIASNYKAKESLESFLIKQGVAGIANIDTRALTKHIREKGAMRSVICSDEKKSTKELLQELLEYPKMDGMDLCDTVSCREKYLIKANDNAGSRKKYKVIAFDFGMKQNIINKLLDFGCEIEVVPANTSAEYILKENPDGVFLSNGPGDPAAIKYAIKTTSTLIEQFHKPIFGICLGHQILALASGAKTYKLKFGHRGINHPIKNLENSKIEIASQNHGFAVEMESLPANLEVTHLNINDNTIAGIKLKSRNNVFSVQYHPEASPGPHDSDYLFKKFVDLMG